jgi:two-component system response regulator FlrC
LNADGLEMSEIIRIAPQTASHVTHQSRGHRPRILVVDREKPIRDIVVPWLFAAGFDCREAEWGQDALDLLKSGARVDLVLSCLLLEDVDGYSLLLYTKQNHPRIPFVFLTAVHDSELRDRIIRDGADGYVLKPCGAAELLAVIRSALAWKKC